MKVSPGRGMGRLYLLTLPSKDQFRKKRAAIQLAGARRDLGEASCTSPHPVMTAKDHLHLKPRKNYTVLSTAAPLAQ